MGSITLCGCAILQAPSDDEDAPERVVAPWRFTPLLVAPSLARIRMPPPAPVAINWALTRPRGWAENRKLLPSEARVLVHRAQDVKDEEFRARHKFLSVATSSIPWLDSPFLGFFC